MEKEREELMDAFSVLIDSDDFMPDKDALKDALSEIDDYDFRDLEDIPYKEAIDSLKGNGVIIEGEYDIYMAVLAQFWENVKNKCNRKLPKDINDEEPMFSLRDVRDFADFILYSEIIKQRDAEDIINGDSDFNVYKHYIKTDSIPDVGSVVDLSDDVISKTYCEYFRNYLENNGNISPLPREIEKQVAQPVIDYCKVNATKAYYILMADALNGASPYFAHFDIKQVVNNPIDVLKEGVIDYVEKVFKESLGESLDMDELRERADVYGLKYNKFIALCNEYNERFYTNNNKESDLKPIISTGKVDYRNGASVTKANNLNKWLITETKNLVETPGLEYEMARDLMEAMMTSKIQFSEGCDKLQNIYRNLETIGIDKAFLDTHPVVVGGFNDCLKESGKIDEPKKKTKGRLDKYRAGMVAER